MKRSLILIFILIFFSSCGNILNDLKEDLGKEPEIAIFQIDSIIANNQIVDYGKIESLTSNELSFTIKNNGTEYLSLKGKPDKVLVIEEEPKFFSVTLQPKSPLAPEGGTTTFTIKFMPLYAVSKTAKILIDTSKDALVFNVTGTGTGLLITTDPTNANVTEEIIVKAEEVFDFGPQGLNTPKDIVFKMKNQGTTTVFLANEPILIDGANKNNFAVSVAPSLTLEPEKSTKFILRFVPNQEGDKIAKVSIYKKGSSTPAFSFSAKGLGIIPKIQVSADMVSAGTFDFGSAIVGTTDLQKNFFLRNTGTQELLLTGSPFVRLTGEDAASFTVVKQPDSTIAAKGQTEFLIRFNPATPGRKYATVIISNNDSLEGNFTFIVTAESLRLPEPDIQISFQSSEILNGGTVYLGSSDLNTTLSVSVTINNLGNKALNLTGSTLIALSGTDMSHFSVTQPSVNNIPAGASTAFSVQFTPTSLGMKIATLSISSDDPDEGTISFNIKGVPSGLPGCVIGTSTIQNCIISLP